MGIFDFGPKPPAKRVTPKEYKEHVLPILHSHDFSDKDLGVIEGLVSGNMELGDVRREGITADEIDTMMSWLKENRKHHSLSDAQIGIFEHAMVEYLNKSGTF